MAKSGIHVIDTGLTDEEARAILEARAETASRHCDSQRLGRILEVMLDLDTADLTPGELCMLLDHEQEQRDLDAEMEAA